MVGEKYGWMVEIDPNDPDYRLCKPTALGRFRHENITMRVERGKKLVAYMGDDRHGGHTYKYVSAGRVTDPKDKNNSALFESGTLYAARYQPNGTGRWIPLELDTKTNPNIPSSIAATEIAQLGKATNNGLVCLPRGNGVAGQTTDGGALSVTINSVVNSSGVTTSFGEADALPDYRNKRLSDFYTTQGAISCDAFLAANLVGATPTARPEDLEVHPRTKDVFIAYIAIQHPGEDCPFSPQVALNRDIEMLNLDGTLFTQNRTVPRGSN